MRAAKSMLLLERAIDAMALVKRARFTEIARARNAQALASSCMKAAKNM
jgi:hypothetical protein